MTLLEKLNEADKEVKKFEEEHLFCRNSRDEFAISKQIIQSAIKHLDYSPLTQEEIKETLGRQWKINVKNICILYSFLQQSKFYNENNPVMVSTTLYKQIKVDGKQVFSNASRIEAVIESMKKIKAIYCVDSHYAKDIKKARIYLLADNRIKSLFSLIREDNNIRKREYILSNDDLLDNSNDILEKEEDFNENVDERMRESYNNLSLFKLINQANCGVADVFKYKATGWRPSASICYVPSKDKHKQHKIQHDVYREDLIPFEYKEYDRNASIYNLSLYLGKGVIRENDRSKYDFYTEFAKRLQCIEYGHLISFNEREDNNMWKRDSIYDSLEYNNNNNNNNNNNDNDNDNDIVRESVKILMMSINFASLNQLRSLINDSVSYLMTRDSRCFKKFRKFQQRLVSIVQILGLECFPLKDAESYMKLSKVLYYFFKEAKKELREYLGRNIEDKSIFLYEAVVNLKCQSLIKEAGYNCVSVYDGFYTDCSEDFWWDCYKKSLIYLKVLIKTQEDNYDVNGEN